MRLVPRHCVANADSSHSAILSQLPCFGVKWSSRRWARRNCFWDVRMAIACSLWLSVSSGNCSHHLSGTLGNSTLTYSCVLFLLCLVTRQLRQSTKSNVFACILSPGCSKKHPLNTRQNRALVFVRQAHSCPKIASPRVKILPLQSRDHHASSKMRQWETVTIAALSF
jgi:hypothetical protein